MKTILKIVVLGVIAGITLRFLDEREIQVRETAIRVVERLERMAEGLIRSLDERNREYRVN